MNTPPEMDFLPPWAQVMIGVLGGGALVRLTSVWLENKRLMKSDYRDTLMSRIHDLETENGELHDEIATLYREVGELRGRLHLLDEQA